jgi:NAD-specific glutamate dehydrogenase
MLTLTVIATVVAAVSALVAMLALRQAKRSADAAEDSLAEAERSADAAEESTGAAAVTAAADRAEDHRRRTPRLAVAVEAKAEHDGSNVIYGVTNEGPADLDSVVVHRPILGDVERRIVHPVARTGAEYGDAAEIGPVAMGTYGRFTLSRGSASGCPSSG